MTKSLTVHRNTLERRIRKAVQSEMVSDAKRHGTQDVVAYAIVTINADGTSRCSWDTGSALPLWAFAATIHAALAMDVHVSGIEETWKPSMQERKRPKA